MELDCTAPEFFIKSQFVSIWNRKWNLVQSPIRDISLSLLNWVTSLHRAPTPYPDAQHTISQGIIYVSGMQILFSSHIMCYFLLKNTGALSYNP